MSLSQEQIQYQLDHKNEDRASDIIVTHVVCLSLAVVFVALRFISRRLKAGLGIDDWVMLLALFLITCECTGVLLGTIHYGSAKHMIFVKDGTAVAKITLAVQELYTTGISCVKISVLLMYHRIFQNTSRRFHIALWATGAFIVAYNFVQFLVILFQCTPVKAAWDPTVPGAKCIKLMLELEVSGCFNALTDIITVCLPMPLLWRAQMPPRKKYQVIATFLVGGFVCIVSVWRVPMQAGISLVDASYTDVTACNWSFVELSVAIMCGCLPTLRPLIGWCLNGGKLDPETVTGRKTSSATSWFFRSWERKASKASSEGSWEKKTSSDESSNPGTTASGLIPWGPDRVV
ncbi:MAG: hypothetical protein Q9228_006139 [Teloschistes exilis]